jgi:hypothetical protein
MCAALLGYRAGYLLPETAMRKIPLPRLIVAFCLSTFVLAWAAPLCKAADAIDAAKEKDIRKLLDLSGSPSFQSLAVPLHSRA